MSFKIGSQRKQSTVSFENILPELIKELKFEDSFIIEKIKLNWSKIVGEIIATHSLPQRIFKKTLFITVDHSIYGNELMISKDLILKKIQKETSINFIKNLRVEIKRLKWSKNNAQQV